MNRMLRSVIKRSVSVFDDFASRLGGDLVNLFHDDLEKAYFGNLVE